ncbi:MAG: cytochrome c oxidase subunit II, partial [Hyphomicrobiales bacterium]|nr:cytochrome c oxidase subunit II [Hyphomicrobiales bacterium]
MTLFSRLTAYKLPLAAFGILACSGGAALAALGHPVPWQMGLQDSATPIMDDITGFNTFLFWITSA